MGNPRSSSILAVSDRGIFHSWEFLLDGNWVYSWEFLLDGKPKVLLDLGRVRSRRFS